MPTRRNLVAGASVSLAALVVPGTGSAEVPIVSPIMKEASYFPALSRLAEEFDDCERDDELDAVREEEIRLSETIANTPPKVLADAAILLMMATDAMRSDSFRSGDGTYTREHGEIIVRRVMHFLADLAGIKLADYGGESFLPAQEPKALVGSVAEAVRQFNGVDETKAQKRRDEYDEMVHGMIMASRPQQERMRSGDVS